ncbi:MAG: hypothetical protein HY964_08655 [Ignavibacteriales bacterium]|nr:hypothetical protein [Ignavibacteriales bacterium]
MKKIIFCFIGLSLVLLAFNCSELKKSLPVASSGELKLHDSGWDNPESANFHGKYLDVKEYNFDECTRCHGGNYSGGTSGVSCFSCHSAYPHKAGWTVVDSASYHGKYLKSKDWNVTECQGCHGTNYTGGTSGVSCRSCHPSFPHSDNFDESNGHPVYMRTNEFPMDQCKVCHGSNYDGGTIVSSSCRGCHDNPAGPEQCNTCHGDYSGAGLIATAPPKSVDGDTATTVRGVGAHQKHLISGILGKSVKCQECHTVPSQLADAGHIDSPFNVTVAFNDTLAKLITADGSYNPQYQKSTLKCDNTFCHGNWKLRKTSSALQFAYTDSVMVGSKYSPAWTGGSSESLCGTTCHTLPPTGHISATLTGCFACHSGVIDGTGAIIDSSKHVNGKINVFGSESNFPQ